MNPTDLSRNVLWKEGPTCLIDNEDTTKQGYEDPPQECLQEMKSKASSVLLVKSDPNGIRKIMNCEDYSDLQRLLRVTAYVLRFVHLLLPSREQTPTRHSKELRSEDLVEAEAHWIKEIQSAVRGNPKFEEWKLQLGLFTDDKGIMRCKGRLENAELPPSTKYPVLLDANHYVTSLIVKDSHQRVMHSGVKATLTEIRARFWIVRGRQFVRKLLYQCVTCRRLEGRPYMAPPPPPLPEIRVKETAPFSCIGLDYAGPLYVKSFGKQLQSLKVWICLHTCCVTRAVHLDVVPDLTAPAFLRSFRRFTARRGSPYVVVSDNGSTFKPASQQIVTLMNDPSVQQYLATERMQWKFNIAKAPWWGGIFERLVKSVKRCLRKTIGGAKLTYEELLTVVVEAETILNSRPLSFVSTEDLEEPLTPSHLLCGRRLLSLPDNNTSDTPDIVPDVEQADLTRRIRHLSTVMNHFWRRWRNEYLLELRATHRLVSQESNDPTISVGDVVVVYEDNQPRGLWKLGLVQELIVGADGCTRGAVVRVQSKKGRSKNLQRPVQHLYPLEINSKAIEPRPEVEGARMEPLPELANPGQRRRREAAEEADRRRRRWIEELT